MHVEATVVDPVRVGPTHFPTPPVHEAADPAFPLGATRAHVCDKVPEVHAWDPAYETHVWPCVATGHHQV